MKLLRLLFLIVVIFCYGCSARVNTPQHVRSERASLLFKYVNSNTRADNNSDAVLRNTFSYGLASVFPDIAEANSYRDASKYKPDIFIEVMSNQVYTTAELYINTSGTVTIYDRSLNVVERIPFDYTVANWSDTKNDYSRAASGAINQVIERIEKSTNINNIVNASQPLRIEASKAPAISFSGVREILSSYPDKKITTVSQYEYIAKEGESKESARANAVEMVKRISVEKVCSFVSSYTTVQDFQLKSDTIQSRTLGLAEVNPISEQWDGRRYFIEAEVTTNPRTVAILMLNSGMLQ